MRGAARGLAGGLCAALLAGCSGGSGGAGQSGAGGNAAEVLTDTLTVLGHAPLDDAVEVPTDASLTIDFDGVLALECLAEPDTWVREAGSGAAVPGDFTLIGDGRRLQFVPATPFAVERDYTVQLSAFTCDTDGRLLEEDYVFGFRTVDTTPPSVVACNVAHGSAGVDRSAVLTIDCDEQIDAHSVSGVTVTLHDAFGTPVPCERTVDRARITIRPHAGLPGDRAFVLAARGLEDRAGNRQTTAFSVSFRTVPDTTPPQLVFAWPADREGVSPRVCPALAFDESMDPYSVESAAVRIVDEYGNVLPYDVEASVDGRDVRLRPRESLAPGRGYVLLVSGGPGAATDVSGNPLATDAAFAFRTGSDDRPPRLVAIRPDPALALPPDAPFELRFDEPLDPDRVHSGTVRLIGPRGEVALDRLVLAPDGTRIALAALDLLEVSTTYTLSLAAGHDGLRDRAGNPLPEDPSIVFTTTPDPTPPRLQVWPYHGAGQVPVGAHVSAYAAEPLDPSTVHAGTVQVFDAHGVEVRGRVALAHADRWIVFEPDAPWVPGARYDARFLGGPDGLREVSGNWLANDLLVEFHTATSGDTLPPDVSITVNGIHPDRATDLVLPQSGFTIDVRAFDPDFSLDMASTRIELSGPAPAPGADAVHATALVDGSELHWRLPRSLALAPGKWTLRAHTSDLSGNEGTSPTLQFRVAALAPPEAPFDRTQVVWVRFDMDRDGNGRGDLEDDLLALGLAAAGDPLGTNARMVAIVRDGILARAHRLFHRKSNGGRLGADSVAVRFTHRRPLGVPFMQIACGGSDPEGRKDRGYGDDSTGTLGRAYFDYRNAQTNDQAIGTNPGLGVFPREMFLFEAQIHMQVYPSFLTSFGRRFVALAPAMGGTPAGSDPLDARVLAPDFDPAGATSAELARYTAVFAAADDWATVIGTILAHEVGHAVGLVAEGRTSAGLHGDGSLHNEFSGITDVMAAAVGYESLVALDYAFRDLNIAYLRHRVILK